MQHNQLVGQLDPGVGVNYLVVEKRVGDGDSTEHAERSGQLFVEPSEESTRSLIAQFSHANNTVVVVRHNGEAE